MHSGNLANPDSVISLWDAGAIEASQYKHLGFLWGDISKISQDAYAPDDLDSFLGIGSIDAALAFLLKHPMLYGDLTLTDDMGEDSITAVVDASGILNLAIWLYAQDGALERKAWNQALSLYFGHDNALIVDYHGDEANGFLEITSSINPYTELLTSYTQSQHITASWRYGYWPFPDCQADDSEDAKAKKLLDARELEGTYQPIDHLGMVSIYQDFNDGVSCQAIADSLMTLHLCGIRTIADDLTEQRKAENGITALWWLALDRLRSGRIYQCAACGKIGVATDERGWKRKYCSDACKQWKSKHPDEMRPPRQ